MLHNKGKPWPKRILALATAIMVASMPQTALADMQGIDVSSWQPGNITRLVDADFAVVKATQGTSYTNPYWKSQIRGAVDTGKSIGLYHYAGGGNATTEADWFLSVVSDYVGDAVLVLDWESNQNGQWGNGAWVWTFVSRVHSRTNVWPIVYVQASAISQIPQQVWDKCGLWVAQYASNATTGYQSNPWRLGAYGEAMRQYTSSGRLAGYAGNLDLNLFRGEEWQWDAYARGDGAKRPSTGSSSTTHTTTGSSGGSNGSSSSSGSGKVCVVVQSGDTLSGIASRYGGSVSQWSGYRSGSASLIYPGETVCRTGTSGSGSSGSTSSGTLRVTIKSGDTISAIAARHNAYPLTAWTVPSGNINLIYPGQVATYKGATTTSTSRTYTVRSGDTLSGIAARLGVGISQITGYRSGNPSLIYPGEVLRY